MRTDLAYVQCISVLFVEYYIKKYVLNFTKSLLYWLFRDNIYNDERTTLTKSIKHPIWQQFLGGGAQQFWNSQWPNHILTSAHSVGVKICDIFTTQTVFFCSHSAWYYRFAIRQISGTQLHHAQMNCIVTWLIKTILHFSHSWLFFTCLPRKS